MRCVSERVSVMVSGLKGFIGFAIRSTPENRQKLICRLNYSTLFPFQHLLASFPSNGWCTNTLKCTMTIHYPSLSYTHTRTGHVLWLLNFFEALHLKFVLFCANGVSVTRGLEHIIGVSIVANKLRSHDGLCLAVGRW